MQIFEYPENWNALLLRPQKDSRSLTQTVTDIFREVKAEGDAAVIRYTALFDKVQLASLAMPPASMAQCAAVLSPELKAAMQVACDNITKFHKAQQEKPVPVETTSGVTCWRESRPIDKVGIYIPGGSAPLFSTVLMLGIPAMLAGCKEVILCSPPDREGNIHPAILYAAQLTGIRNIFRTGGIQAIAALTFGTDSIPKVDKIFGPGNQYVTAAKQQAQQEGLAIDMPAGPSEVLIIADATCNPLFVAADLLAQAEHGGDSQVILLCDHPDVLRDTLAAIEQQLNDLPRKAIIRQALAGSRAILLQHIEECMAFSNLYAPEHLIIACADAASLIPMISNAGSVFLGNYSCESAGDYASGTNHTLPTNGYSKSYSGVSLDSFVKKITFQELSPQGIRQLGPHIEVMAEAEALLAHKNAVTIRLNTLKDV